MINVNRRALLGSAALAPLLGACASLAQKFDATLASVVADAKLVAGAAADLLPWLDKMGVPSSVSLLARDAIAGIQQVADALLGVASEAAAKPWVQKLADYVQALIGALQSVPGLPVVVAGALQAMSIVVPAIASVLGMLGVASPRMTAPPIPAMTLSEARLRLRAIPSP